VRAAVEVPADLEDRDDRRPEGGRIRFDLGCVLAGRIAVRVDRGTSRDRLAVSPDAVEAVDGREVVAAAAGDDVSDGIDRLQPVGLTRSTDSCGCRDRGGDE
jgi:hypothetical protein